MTIEEKKDGSKGGHLKEDIARALILEFNCRSFLATIG